MYLPVPDYYVSLNRVLEDIVTIVKKEKNFDWQLLIDETIWQHNHGDSRVLLDVEEMMNELKKYVFIEQKYLRQLYKAAPGGKRRLQKTKKFLYFSTAKTANGNRAPNPGTNQPAQDSRRAVP